MPGNISSQLITVFISIFIGTNQIFWTSNNRSEWHFRQCPIRDIRSLNLSNCQTFISIQFAMNIQRKKINCNRCVFFCFLFFHLSIDVFDSPFQNRICFNVIPFNRIFDLLFRNYVLKKMCTRNLGEVTSEITATFC